MTQRCITKAFLSMGDSSQNRQTWSTLHSLHAVDSGLNQAAGLVLKESSW